MLSVRLVWSPQSCANRADWRIAAFATVAASKELQELLIAVVFRRVWLQRRLIEYRLVVRQGDCKDVRKGWWKEGCEKQSGGFWVRRPCGTQLVPSPKLPLPTLSLAELVLGLDRRKGIAQGTVHCFNESKDTGAPLWMSTATPLSAPNG